MACTSPCSACDRKDLPILFTRYAAAYSAQPEHMTALAALRPSGRFQAHPDGVEIKTASYQVRMLRSGVWAPFHWAGERLCTWPTFPEVWNSDCGQR